jgi:cholesterol oxidase
MTASSGDTTALEFTEEMKGYATLGESDYERGFRQGKESDTFLMFHLTIRVDDVDRFVADPAHEGTAAGWVECQELGGKLPVERGVFNLFVDTDDPARSHMLYRLFFADGAGHPLTFSGFKDVKDDPGWDVWQDTSTLYTKIFRGHVDADGEKDAEVVATGIINIYMQDFAKQLTTFRVHGPNMQARMSAMTAFGKLFLGELWDLYARVIPDTTETPK